MTRHPFADHRPVMIAVRRPLFQVLGTEAARVRDLSEPHVRAAQARKANRRARDPILSEGFGGH